MRLHLETVCVQKTSQPLHPWRSYQNTSDDFTYSHAVQAVENLEKLGASATPKVVYNIAEDNKVHSAPSIRVLFSESYNNGTQNIA